MAMVLKYIASLEVRLEIIFILTGTAEKDLIIANSPEYIYESVAFNAVI